MFDILKKIMEVKKEVIEKIFDLSKFFMKVLIDIGIVQEFINDDLPPRYNPYLEEDCSSSSLYWINFVEVPIKVEMDVKDLELSKD